MRVLKDGKPRELTYTPPPPAVSKSAPPSDGGMSSRVLAEAIINGFRAAIAGMPAPVVNVEAPVVNVPKPEVRVNSPVYVQPPEVKVPATTVHVPEQKSPVVNIEPAAVTLQTNRPDKWKFTIERDEFGRMTTIYAEAK
jgi:hypothetical protein